jgi:glycosyltransferase involved in cell wall biosynthesis
MQRLEANQQPRTTTPSIGKLPVTVIIPVRNEARNLPRCLQALGEIGEVYVVDSQSTDSTVEIARNHGAQVVQFHYQGGWPKKRQWAMDNLPLSHDWILLLDADEVLTPELIAEIRSAIQNPAINGYYIALRIYFLGRLLQHGDARFWKLSVFRRRRPSGHMPMANEDRSLFITYNGEVYNFAELRRQLQAKGYRFVSDTDTEVVLHLYEEEGPD